MLGERKPLAKPEEEAVKQEAAHSSAGAPHR